VDYAIEFDASMFALRIAATFRSTQSFKLECPRCLAGNIWSIFDESRDVEGCAEASHVEPAECGTGHAFVPAAAAAVAELRFA